MILITDPLVLNSPVVLHAGGMRYLIELEKEDELFELEEENDEMDYNIIDGDIETIAIGMEEDIETLDIEDLIDLYDKFNWTDF